MPGGETQVEVIARMTDAGMRVMRGIENQDAAGLISAYRNAQDEIIAKIQQAFQRTTLDRPGQWTFAEMSVANRDQQLIASINETLSRLAAETNGLIEQADINQFKEGIRRAGYALDQATPSTMPVRLPILPEQNIKALVNTPFEGAMFSQRIGVITNAMSSDIRDGLLQSMINGESMNQASDRVANIIGAANKANPDAFANRARAIARSEIMRAQNMGRQSVFIDNADMIDGDPEETWAWVLTPDDRLCPWCKRREGMTPEEIKKAPAGRDPFGNSTAQPLHPYCRCTRVPKLKTWKQLGIDMPDEWDQGERGERDPVSGKWKVQPVQSYNDWLNTRAGDMPA